MSEIEDQLYNVTIYVTMKVKVDGIRADSQFHASEEASNLMTKSGIIGRGEVTLSTEEDLLENVRYMDYADEISGYLVDLVGDEEYSQTMILDPNGETYRTPSDLKGEVITLTQSVGMLQDAYCELFTAVENGIDTDTFFKLRQRFHNVTAAVASESVHDIFHDDQIETVIREHFRDRLDAELAENGLEEIARLIGRYSMMSPLQALASIREIEAEHA